MIMIKIMWQRPLIEDNQKQIWAKFSLLFINAIQLYN